MTLSYKDAGVDKEAGYREVKLIKEMVKKTFSPPAVISDLGGFGGLFKLDTAAYQEPVLVSGTDGVGTKLDIAFRMDKHDTIGIDAVAMCANDILCQGAKPLFFLDYIATGKLVPEKWHRSLKALWKAVSKRRWRSSVAKPPKCPASIRKTITISPALPWVLWIKPK